MSSGLYERAWEIEDEVLLEYKDKGFKLINLDDLVFQRIRIVAELRAKAKAKQREIRRELNESKNK